LNRYTFALRLSLASDRLGRLKTSMNLPGIYKTTFC
jgi:hypothetical protein